MAGVKVNQLPVAATPVLLTDTVLLSRDGVQLNKGTVASLGDAIPIVKYAATKSAGDTLSASLPDGVTVITDEDEAATPIGVQTRRTVLSGALTAIASFLKTSMIAWKHGGTGAVWRTLYARLNDLPVSVKDFGVSGNGSDETANFSLALQSSSGLILDGCGLTVRVDAAIVSTAENITIKNLTLDFSSAPNISADADFMLTFRGSQGSQVLVTTDVQSGFAIIQVANSASFLSDGYAWLESDAEFATGSTTGQVVKIKSVDSSTQITLYSDVLYDFNVADSARISPLSLRENIVLQNVKVIGANTNKQSAVNFEFCYAPKVHDSFFSYVDLISIRAKRCVYPSFTQNNMVHTRDSALGYGVAIVDGCYAANASKNTGEDMRHLVTFGGDSGVNIFCTAEGNFGSGMKDAGIDAHPSTDFTKFVGNTIEGVYSSASPTPRDGIIYQGANPTIIGNYIIGAYVRAIAVEHYAKIGKSTILVADNHIKNTGDAGTTSVGISVESEQSGTTDIIGLAIGGNVIGGDNDHAIFLKAETSSIKNLSICNNVGESPTDSFSIYFQASASESITNFAINGNILESTGASCVHLAADSLSGISLGTISGNNLKAINYAIRYINCSEIVERSNILKASTNINFVDSGSFDINIDRSYRGIRTTTNSASTVAEIDSYIIVNRAGTHTMTLPSPSVYPNRELTVKTIQAQQVISSSSNVAPIDSASVGQSILPAVAGSWALLKSNGSNWVIMQKG
jgi:hypothetical protein